MPFSYTGIASLYNKGYSNVNSADALSVSGECVVVDPSGAGDFLTINEASDGFKQMVW